MGSETKRSDVGAESEAIVSRSRVVTRELNTVRNIMTMRRSLKVRDDHSEIHPSDIPMVVRALTKNRLNQRPIALKHY